MTLWTTQHPCTMYAAAMRFVGIDQVVYLADDPSESSSPADIIATRKGVPYQALGYPLCWTISNLLFLHNSAMQHGAEARNLRINQDRYPALVTMELDMTADGQSRRKPERTLRCRSRSYPTPPFTPHSLRCPRSAL